MYTTNDFFFSIRISSHKKTTRKQFQWDAEAKAVVDLPFVKGKGWGRREKRTRGGFGFFAYLYLNPKRLIYLQ